jgi:hypothetical protein
MTPPTPILELLKSVPPGPYFVDHHQGTAEDFKAHANSGLATVDTGRAEDWPVAYFCEWPQAQLIARLSPEVIRETVEALLANESLLEGMGEPDSPFWREHQKRQRALNAHILNRLNGVET